MWVAKMSLIDDDCKVDSIINNDDVDVDVDHSNIPYVVFSTQKGTIG